jgi:hypothetical protein
LKGVRTSHKRPLGDSLNIPTDPDDTDDAGNPEGGSATLSRCRELRELEVSMSVGGTDDANLISSITSMNIQKITFVYSISWAPCRVKWGNLDNALCQLADRPGYKGKLEANFWIVGAGVRVESEVAKSFAKFGERGRFVVTRADRRGGGESVICSSDGVM